MDFKEKYLGEPYVFHKSDFRSLSETEKDIYLVFYKLYYKKESFAEKNKSVIYQTINKICDDYTNVNPDNIFGITNSGIVIPKKLTNIYETTTDYKLMDYALMVMAEMKKERFTNEELNDLNLFF